MAEVIKDQNDLEDAMLAILRAVNLFSKWIYVD